jgi:hypothetical protein
MTDTTVTHETLSAQIDDLGAGIEAIKDRSAQRRDAIELAYGLLWRVGCDRQARNGEALYQARKALYEQLDPAGQARGIEAAAKIRVEAESRKNPRTADAGEVKYWKSGQKMAPD